MDLLQTLHIVADIMKMCMWSFDEDKINFDRIMPVKLVILSRFYSIGYWGCVIHFFHNFNEKLHTCVEGLLQNVHACFSFVFFLI